MADYTPPSAWTSRGAGDELCEHAPDADALARAEEIRGEVRARRAEAETRTDDRVGYAPGTGDRENIRRSGRA